MFNKPLIVMVILCVGFVCAFNVFQGHKSFEENSRRRREEDDGGSPVAERSGPGKDGIWDTLKSWKDAALHKLKDLMESAKEGDQVKALQEFVLEAKDKVVESAKNAGDNATKAAHKAADKLAEIAKSVKVRVGETAHAAVERVQKLVDEVVDEIRN